VTRQLLGAAGRHPWLLTAALATLATLLADTSMEPGDFPVFARAGRALLRGDLGAVYADSGVQAGPLALAFTGVVAALPAPALVFVFCWVNSACLIGALRTVVGAGATRRGIATLAGGLLALAYGTLTTTDAHPTHAVIALLWFLAVRAAIRDRPVVAALLLGVACGLDTWAVLGAGALIALPSRRSRFHAAGIVTVTIAAVWLPFVASGTFHSLDHAWTATPGSLPFLLVGEQPVPWSYRAVQGVVAVAAGLAVAWRRRRRDDLAWLLPVVVVTVRLLLDPIHYGYYDVPVVLMSIVGITARVAVGAWSRLPWLAAALLLPPVAGLFGGILVTYGPSALCLAVFVCAGSQGSGPVGVPRRRFTHRGREVPDQVRLVGVTEVRGQGRPVQLLVPGDPLRHLVQPVPADHPLGPDADVVGEPPLQPPHAHPGECRDVVHAPELPVCRDPLGPRGGVL
jgi:hypothetical protein